jgi:hypothetical protein
MSDSTEPLCRRENFNLTGSILEIHYDVNLKSDWNVTRTKDGWQANKSMGLMLTPFECSNPEKLNGTLKFVCGTPEEIFPKQIQYEKPVSIIDIIERLRQEALAKRKGK